MLIPQSQKNTEISQSSVINNVVKSADNSGKETDTEIKKLKSIKEEVENNFSDIPIMIEIARCESSFRHKDSTGNVLRGNVNKADVGVMQINEKYHADTAVRLGIDIYSLDGNMEYARYLYDTQGTKPWFHSSKCWNSKREVAIAE